MGHRRVRTHHRVIKRMKRKRRVSEERNRLKFYSKDAFSSQCCVKTLTQRHLCQNCRHFVRSCVDFMMATEHDLVFGTFSAYKSAQLFKLAFIYKLYCID